MERSRRHRTGISFRTGRDLIGRCVNNRMRTPRLIGIRTDVGVGARSGTGAVVGEARELMAADQPEVVLDDVLTSGGIGPEPGLVSVRPTRDTKKVRVSTAGVGLSVTGSGVELRLPDRRAADEAGALFVGARDGEGTGEFEFSHILDGSVEVLGSPIAINVGEQVRWLDGVVSRSGFGEVVSGRD